MVIFQEAGGEIIFFCVTELGWLFTPASSLEAILVQPAVVCCCVFCGTDFSHPSEREDKLAVETSSSCLTW